MAGRRLIISEQKNCYESDAARWAAVKARDPLADGKFLYAVKTTGVFCRPTCASRPARSENVVFFSSAEDAQRAGFRACKRCNPAGIAPREQQAAIVARACRLIDEAQDKAPSLEELACDADLSPWHFQRVFKRIIGISPKQYATTSRMRRLRAKLDIHADQKSVTGAIFDTGFSSASRAYELAGRSLGMTPNTYRNGAPGEEIRYALARCYLGGVAVAATERGICAIELGDDENSPITRLEACFPKANLRAADADFSATIERVVQLLEEPDRGLDLPLDIRGTAFQQRVWHAIQAIPPGETASYAELAQHIGEPKATRAVAQACGANKIAVAIPCHRVVRADGGLSGYRWGVERKRELLDREKQVANER